MVVVKTNSAAHDTPSFTHLLVLSLSVDRQRFN